MTHRTTAHLFKRTAVVLAISVALPGAVLAAVNAPASFAATVAGVDAMGMPGGTATVHFDFDFGSGVSVSTAIFSLQWDPSLLSAVGAAASYNGVPIDVAAALSAAGTYEPLFTPEAGNFGALWSAYDQNFDPLPPLNLSGPARLSFTYALDGAFAVPGRTDVALSLLLADDLGNPLAPLDAVASISAVPEPAHWAMLLAGGAGVLAVTRRRRNTAA